MPTYGLTKYHAGLAQVVFTFNTAETAWTQYLTLSHLRVQNAITGVTMYDASNTAFTYNDPYGIYLQEAEHVTLLDNEIINNTGGTFGAANGPDTCNYCDFDNYLTLQGNHFFYNGQVAAFHQSYIEGYMVSYIGNFFDRIKQGGSTQLKDRSTGTVIAYNLFYPGAHALDLVDAQNSFFALVHQIDVTVPTGGFSANATSLTFTPLTVSGNTTNGSIVISIPSTTGITQDMAISGTGIPVGATVILVSGSSIQISSPATATGSPTLTIGGVAGINIGDVVGYDAAAGWGYAGSGSPVMPTVSNVNTSTNTLTLNSPGIPASLSAGAALQVISRQLYPYLQTFVYGNVFSMNQLLLNSAPGAPIHYGWDTQGGLDSVQDRAGTLYIYDNTFVVQWDHTTSVGASYRFPLFQTESDADTVEADDNIFYTSKAPGSSNSATYLIAIEAGAFAGEWKHYPGAIFRRK